MNKIGFKLILAVGITTVISIGVYSFFMVRSISGGLEGEVERHANQLSETVKYGTRYDMLFNQRDRIHELVRNMAAQPSINRIRVLNKSGEVVYSSREEDIGQMVDKQAEACYACHAADKPLERLSIEDRTRIYRVHADSTRFLGIINPIYNEPSCWEASCHEHDQGQTVLGVLDVVMSLEDVDQRIRQSEIEMLIFAVVAIVVLSFIVAVFVERWVDWPVRDLLSATEEVASGNLSHTIPAKRSDELGLLARSFNHMTAKLSEARLQLFQSDKMASLGRLAAGVAHEINNPLTGVLTYSSFLLKRTQDRPEIQEDLKVIVRETLRSREIVKSLLDFARQSVPKKTEADIHEILDRAQAVVENQLSLNKVRVVRQLDSSLPRITVDSNQMQQVFINLLVNAADAIGRNGGTITVQTSLLCLSPYGMLNIRKAQCPKRHNLIDNEFKIDGRAAVKLRMVSNEEEGFLYLDPLYGSHHHRQTVAADGEPLQLSCPQCHTSLMDPEKKCPVCSAPVFRFDIPGKGQFENCSRKGCEWQRWAAVDEEGHKDYVEIRVQDSGCGIPKEDLPRIFEPFFSSKGQKGTGLGLSVIWGIIDNHNGSITVQSEGGKGTTFTIRLPVKE